MPKGYHHVTLDRRSQMYALTATGTSIHCTASIVGYYASLISRAIKRTIGGRGYRYKRAEAKAVQRRKYSRGTPKKLTPLLLTVR